MDIKDKILPGHQYRIGIVVTGCDGILRYIDSQRAAGYLDSYISSLISVYTGNSWVCISGVDVKPPENPDSTLELIRKPE